MSGWVMCHGSCVACQAPIAFNPHRVPSLTVSGQREPLCRVCFARWNTIHRTSKGLEALPLNSDAYEPMLEELL